MQKHMPQLRNIIADELENNQVQERQFELLSSDVNHKLTSHKRKQRACKENIQPRKFGSKASECDPQSPYYNSDSDFEIVKKVKKMKSSDETEAKESGADSCQVCNWAQLNPALQSFLPSEDGLTYYVTTEFTSLTPEAFPGAPKYSFKATIRVKISKKEEAQSWIKKMMVHSL